MPVRRYQLACDIYHEAKLQDEDRFEEDLLHDYRASGMKPTCHIETTPIVEDDPFISRNFEEILAYRKQVARIESEKKYAPLLEKLLEVDIEVWNRLSEEYYKNVTNPLFDIDL